jgi:Xaa-Pro dipeptidase
VNTSHFSRRMITLKSSLRKKGFSGAIISPGPNMKYYTGVSSFLLERPFLLFVPTEGVPHLVAPKFEAGPYRRCGVEMEVHDWNDGEGPSDAFAAATKGIGTRGIWGVEGRAPYRYLYVLGKSARFKFEDGESILQGIREIKSRDEVELLRRSSKILSQAFKKIPDYLRAGLPEHELASTLTEDFTSRGAEKSEDMLVQSGVRATDPHSTASAKRIESGEAVVVDVSTVYEGYFADITRTFVVGRNEQAEDIYGKVLEAQESAIRKTARGVPVGDVDSSARSILTKYGLGEYFTHRVGHGLGLEVHEAPYLIPGGKEKLRSGMVHTIEPGAYIPGKLGVRIEDDLLVTEAGNEVLSDIPKEYGWWR